MKLAPDRTFENVAVFGAGSGSKFDIFLYPSYGFHGIKSILAFDINKSAIKRLMELDELY